MLAKNFPRWDGEGKEKKRNMILKLFYFAPTQNSCIYKHFYIQLKLKHSLIQNFQISADIKVNMVSDIYLVTFCIHCHNFVLLMCILKCYCLFQQKNLWSESITQMLSLRKKMKIKNLLQVPNNMKHCRIFFTQMFQMFHHVLAKVNKHISLKNHSEFCICN